MFCHMVMPRLGSTSTKEMTSASKASHGVGMYTKLAKMDTAHQVRMNIPREMTVTMEFLMRGLLRSSFTSSRRSALPSVIQRSSQD